ncbi:nuclear transport factor 2 family protein [Salinimicrobium sp. GXAS 041]|uniref:nuclear transport factor 2 family protein n=1 Tax=Salinimicrobium sp. GXAS 041 TaxID=3400806 RepID=UPI003C707AC9
MKTRAFKNTAVFALTGMILLFLHFTSYAQTNNSANINYPAAEDDLEIAEATVMAYEAGDWDELRSMLSPDAKIYGLGNTDSLDVDETITYWSRGRDDAAPTLSKNGIWLPVSFSEGPKAGNWVLYWGNNTLTYKNGENISFPFHVSMKLENNLVSEVHFYYDNMKIIRALGYAISPPVEDEDEENELDPDEGY